MRFFLPTILFFLALQLMQAQDRFTVSGTISSAEDGETLYGTLVASSDGQHSTTSNEYGFYSIKLPARDSITLVFSQIGMKERAHRLFLQADTVLNIELGGVEADLQLVEVNASSTREKVNSTQMGVTEVTAKEAKEIPVIFGEVDILKVLQLKPGVQNGGEGSSGIYVRGGGPDQNLFLLDEAPVYNPSHLFGFFSTFNADAIKNLTLYQASFPAEYGGKLSSVIDVKMREGNRKRFTASGGIGLIASRLTLEGPIVKDKASFLISGRRTYVDIFTGLLNQVNKDNEDWNRIPAYGFYDLNAKVNFDIDDKNRIFISGYFGRDVFAFNTETINFGFDWGNATMTARWNHKLNAQTFVNTSFTFSDYKYNIGTRFRNFGFDIGSGIRDFNLRSDFSWFPSNEHHVKYGVNGIYHRFSVNRLEAGDMSGQDTSFQFNAGSIFHAGEYAAYINDEYTVNNRLKVNMGLRASAFNNGAFYWGVEPRLGLKYSLSSDVSLKAGYARMYQYLHLVTTSGASLPTDVWYPSNTNIRPQSSDLATIGTAWAISPEYFFSFEVYYKWLHNQIDFRDGAQLIGNDNLDDEFVFGRGRSYGAEVYVERKIGDLRGWLGYTLSWSWRYFDDIMDGQRFHPRYDRRHDISAVVMYDLPYWRKRFPITLSATWVYGTGNAISLPTSRYFNSDIVGQNPFNLIPVYGERNGYRMAAYHRMDLGIVWNIKPKKEGKRFNQDLTLSIYNVYNRLNPFFIFIDTEFEEDSQLPSRFQAKQVSLFPIIPTITWNFSF